MKRKKKSTDLLSNESVQLKEILVILNQGGLPQSFKPTAFNCKYKRRMLLKPKELT